MLSSVDVAVGAELTDVVYWALTNELCPESFQDPDLYIGGEVELVFENSARFFVSWDECGQWKDHFSLCASPKSVFLPDSLEPWAGSGLQVWEPLLGDILAGYQVLGFNDTPHALHLLFSTASVIIGAGHKQHFGDGDDVLVRPGSEMERISSWQVIFDSNNTSHA